jgi:hypothetical protein
MPGRPIASQATYCFRDQVILKLSRELLNYNALQFAGSQTLLATSGVTYIV